MATMLTSLIQTGDYTCFLNRYFLTFSRDCYYAFFQKIRNFFIRVRASFAEASFFASQ
jgi:hypothetical protein